MSPERLLLEPVTICPSCEQPMVHEPGFFLSPLSLRAVGGLDAAC